VSNNSTLVDLVEQLSVAFISARRLGVRDVDVKEVDENEYVAEEVRGVEEE
jgi:hypothetical protein